MDVAANSVISVSSVEKNMTIAICARCQQAAYSSSRMGLPWGISGTGRPLVSGIIS